MERAYMINSNILTLASGIVKNEAWNMIFVRAHTHRERNFHLYLKEVLEELILLFNAHDHTNYA